MIKTSRLLGSAGALALSVLAAHPALAATAAGTSITNTVSVNFQVGGIAQTASTGSDTFTVDRKVDVVVAEVGTTTTTVSPGQTAAVTTFTVTNNSNATLDFALTAAQLATGATGAHSNTDSFDTSNVKIYVDNGDNTFNAATDTLVTYIDELAGDGAAKTVFVVSDVPLSLATGAVAAITLTATAEAGGTASSEGAALTATSGANTAGMDTVFADAIGAATGDVARDGKHSAKDDYTILAASLTALKRSKIISDPVNGASNPKFIPGATIEYCISIANAAGSATATNITATDVLPTQVTYDSAYGTYLNGTVDGSNQCNTDGTLTAGTYNSGTRTITGTLSDIAAAATRTLRFRATIN